jgi:hypothetical protein
MVHRSPILGQLMKKYLVEFTGTFLLGLSLGPGIIELGAGVCLPHSPTSRKATPFAVP